MMSVLNAVMLAVSSSLAASIAVKATVTTALALLGVWLARRSRAAVRHTLLAAAFGVLLLLPIVSVVAPPVRIAVTPVEERIVPHFPPNTAAISRVAPARPSGAVQAAPPSPGIAVPALLLAAWIAGTVGFLLPVVMGLWQVRALRRSALPWRLGQSAVESLALDAGIYRRVEVLLHEAIPGPMTCGIVHPAILLPQDAQAWAEEDLNRAIVHELEHVRRGDWLSHCLARAVCAVYWFHPLVWIASRRFALEAERSCDDAVLGRSEATAYADQLVGLAQRLSSAAKSPVLAMASRADLAARVGAVLDERQRRGRAGALPVALACAAAALVLTMSPLTVVAAQQAATIDLPAASLPRFSVSANLVVVDVSVHDRSGNDVKGLSADDFAITEDGVSQSISLAEYQEVTPIQGAQGNVRSYYILGYHTSNSALDGAYRRISVRVKPGDAAKLDFRQGYYAEKAFARPGSPASITTGADPGLAPGLTAPVLLYKKEPEYSEAARKAKHQGFVVLYLEVNASGHPTNIKVLRSLGLGLDEKAIDAVQQWTFAPGTKAGKSVAMPVQVEVDFRLL